MSKSKGRSSQKFSDASDPETDTITNAISLGMSGFDLRRITSVTELLRDQDSLIKMAEIVGTGGSINTVEMALGFPPGMLKGWLNNGKQERSDGEYAAFYRFYLAAAAEARRAAEASLLMKNPAKWLETCDPLKQLDIQEQSPAIDTTATRKTTEESGFSVVYRDFD